MKLVAIAALFAVCGAAKLDRMYLPPASAITAGGNSDSLLTPLVKSSSDQGESSVPSGRLPTGSYTNNFQGVVVDAATAGIRASSDSDQSGLGGPRDSYGSTNSKVGDAAFKGSIAGFRNTPSYGSSGSIGQSSGISTGQNFGTFESKSERPQAFKDRNSNIITYANDISPDNYSYGFETDNGIAIGENGVANNGIQAQGGYSYKGDDGQVYKVTYVADEGGYRPQGDHLPTPPPIPKEILVSLEQNAKDEAAGLIDDGSYDAQKYNAEGDYTHHNSGNIQYNGAQSSQFAKRPESDATASNTFINQHNQPFGKPGQLGHIGVHNTHSNYSGPSNQFNENKFGSNNANNQNSLAGSLDNQSSQTQSQSQESSVAGLHSSGHFQHSQQNSGSQLTSHIGQAQGLFESQTSQFDTQKNQQVPVSQFETGSSQFGSQIFQQGSVNYPGGQPSHNNQQFAGQASQVGSTFQFGVQPSKPLLGQNPNSAFNYQMNQDTQFGSQPFKPQSFFGKPSQHSDDKQTQTQVSQIQFATENSNKPTFSSFSSNKPLPVIPNQAQTIINNENHFPNSPTQFGYEYNKPQANEVSSPQETNPNNQIADIVPLEGQNQGFSQGSSASAFASVGPVGLEIQPAKPFNAFQPQIPGLSQFNYNNNNQLISQGQNVPTPALAAGTKPTAIPDTELTTPFGPNEKPISSQESQFNSESADNFGNFGFQSLNNQKPQNILHQNSASSFAHSRPQEVFQFGSSVPTQDVFPAAQQSGSSGGKPQFPQHSFVQNQQNALSQNNNNGYFSTQKPSIIQESHDSYYYNQPSKPFSIPGTHSQDSKFPNSPYQSNSLVSSQNNQFSNQQESSSTKLPVPPSIATVSPTSFPLTPAPGGPSNYYSGITQASVSSFPSVSPTTLSQYDNTQENQFGSKPSINQPTAGSINLLNRPTNSQPNTAVPSFPSKPATTFGQRPSTSFTQNQIQFGQSSPSNSIQPSSSQLSPAKPMSTFGQTPSSSFTQNQIQLGQSTSPSNGQSQTPAVGQEQQTTSTLTQQYQGTVYEYNKPAEVLPAPAKIESSSSQSVQINSAPKPQKELTPENQESKPHYSSQQTQFGQSTFLSQSQQSTLNQGAKPQFGMTFKPFGSSSSNNAQIEQKPQSTSSQTSLHHINQGFQITEQAVKPIETELSATQFGQSSQASLGSRPQFGTQSFGTTLSSTQFGQNTQQKQSAEISSSNQTQEAQSTIQPLKPFGGLQSTYQFGQNTQSSFGSITQNTGSQFAASPNRPFGSTSNPSQSGEALHNQGSHPTGFSSSQHNTPSLSTGSQPYKPFGTIGLTQGAQPIKPFGTAGTNQGFQGYPSSKPQFGTQTQTQLTQSSQQTFGTTQVIQPAGGLHTDTFPVTPFASDSTVSKKPQFGQNIQPNQGTQTSFGSFQSSQFGSSTSNPQFETQAQIGQAHENGSPVKPFGSVSSSAHFSQNSAESSSSMTQQQPSSAQAYKPNENYKPFGATFAQNSDFQSHKQPQFDQAPQPSHGSTTVSPSHFSAQPLKPFNIGPQGSKDKPEVPQNKPFGTQGSPCCQDSKDSSIAPLNVGKPSQAFAQTQSQFTGFQGVQNLNAQAVAGKGEEFGGPRQPPSFDSQTGYHY